MDEELIIAGWDFCSVACAEETFGREKFDINDLSGLRPDGTVRVMRILQPSKITGKQIKRMGKAARPAGLRCPVCGELLPSDRGGGDIYYTDSAPLPLFPS